MSSEPGRRTVVFDFHTRLAPSAGALDRLLAAMDACGIDRAAVAAGGVIDPVRLSRQLVEGGHIDSDPDNDAVLTACRAAGGRLVPVYFANPHRPAARYAAAAAQFRALEISPAVHGVPLADDRVAELVAVASDAGHSVYVVCLARPGCQVVDLVRLARRFPQVVFVLGHSGIGNIDFYGVELAAAQPNIWLETSGGYTAVLRAALDSLGAGRLLFGSEFPLQHPDVELAKYRSLDLPARQWQQIAWENAARILRTGENMSTARRQRASIAGPALSGEPAGELEPPARGAERARSRAMSTATPPARPNPVPVPGVLP